MTSLKIWTGRLLLASLACGLSGIAEAEVGSAQGFDLSQLMHMMADVQERQDRFTERKTMAMLTAPLVLSGTLAYSRPDHVEKHVLEPYEEHLVVHGDELTLTNKKGTKLVKVNSHPLIWSFVEAIRASLAGDIDALERFYEVQLAGTRQEWVLTLRPLDPQAASYLTSVTLKGRGDRLVVVDILETGGDRSVMTIHEPVS